MDALARLKLPGVNFSFNAPFPSALALISQTSLQDSGAALPASRPVGEPNFNASEKGQTWPLLPLRRPLCACPRNATGHYHSLPLIPLHYVTQTQFPVVPVYPIPEVLELETRAGVSRFSIEGWKFRTVDGAGCSVGEMVALTPLLLKTGSCFGREGFVSSGTRRCVFDATLSIGPIFVSWEWIFIGKFAWKRSTIERF